MTISLKNITVIVGNYGSGKTEVAINLALYKKQEGNTVRVADLDLINPYFRTREARHLFKKMDIDIVIPLDQYLHADLPVLSRTVLGLIRNAAMSANEKPAGKTGEYTILDVGGDDAGATVLASLKTGFAGIEKEHIDVLQVLNPLRPFTDTFAGVDAMRKSIEGSAKMEITGIIGNANLIEETTPEIIFEGLDFVKTYASERGLPLTCVTVPEKLMYKVKNRILSTDTEILPIKRQLTPPWIKPAAV